MKKKLLNMSLSLALLFLSAGNIKAQTEEETKIYKDETIYISLSNEGEIKQKSSSVHLHSDGLLKNIEDQTNLANIINIKGKESPEVQDGKITWNLDEKEVFYQGEVKEELPLSFDLNYQLNGQKISAKDLAGKSGELEIQLKIENQSQKTVEDQTYHLPYLVIGAFGFEDDKAFDIEVDQARLMQDGKKNRVLFASLPGMKDNFDLEDWDEIIKISARVEDFAMDALYMSVIPLQFKDGQVDFTEIENLKDDLFSGLTALEQGSLALYEGNQKLNQGLVSLKENLQTAQQGSSTLKDGTTALDQGIQALNQGSQALDSGSQEIAQANAILYQTVSETLMEIEPLIAKIEEGSEEKLSSLKALEEGIQSLNQGLTQLDKNSQPLVQAYGHFHQNLDQLVHQFLSVENIQKEVNAILQDQTEADQAQEIADLIQANQEFSSGLENFQKNLKADQVTDLASLQNHLQQLANDLNLDDQGKEKLEKSIIDLLVQTQNSIGQSMAPLVQSSQELSQGNLAFIESSLAQQQKLLALIKNIDQDGKLSEKLQPLEELYGASEMIYASLQDYTNAVAKAQAGSGQLQEKTDGIYKETKTTFDESLGQIQGRLKKVKKAEGKLKTLSQGAHALALGSSQLSLGMHELSSNSPSLSQGTRDLFSGLSQLYAGSDSLAAGSQDLLVGSQEFYETIADLDLDSGLMDDLSEHVDILNELSKDHDHFSGKSEGMESSYKMVVKGEKIEEEKEEVEEVVEEKEKEGFFQRLKNRFKS